MIHKNQDLHKDNSNKWVTHNVSQIYGHKEKHQIFHKEWVKPAMTQKEIIINHQKIVQTHKMVLLHNVICINKA